MSNWEDISESQKRAQFVMMKQTFCSIFCDGDVKRKKKHHMCEKCSLNKLQYHRMGDVSLKDVFTGSEQLMNTRFISE